MCFFYDHTGAIGKAFVCIDLLRAHPRMRPGGSAEATSRRSWKAPTFRARAMGSRVARLTAVSRHHMQIVYISMTPQLLGTTATNVVPATLTFTAVIATGRSAERRDGGRQAEGRSVVDRRVGGLDGGQGRRRGHERLTRSPLRGGPFSNRRRRHSDDLFRGAGFGQACRRRAPLWSWQGRERFRAPRDGAAVRSRRRGDLGGGQTTHERPAAGGGGNAMGLRRDRALHRRRFSPRTRALSHGGKDVEPCARGGRAPFRFRHVVVPRGA